MSDNDMDYDKVQAVLREQGQIKAGVWGDGFEYLDEADQAIDQLRARVAELEAERADIQAERDKAWERIEELEAENSQIRDHCKKAAMYISDLAPKSDHLMGELNHVAWHFHAIIGMGLSSEGE